MAIARLTAADSTDQLTLTHTVSAGSDRILIVGACWEHDSATTVDSVDFGGQAMVKSIDIVTADAGVMCGASIWYLLNTGIAAASGSVITPTWSNQPPGDQTIHAIAYTGADQTGGATTNPATATAETNEATPNPQVTDLSETNAGLVIGVACTGGVTTTTWHADMTEQTDQQDDSSTGSLSDRLSSTGGNVNIEATFATQNRAAQVAASFAPVSTGVTITVPTGPWR